MTHPSIDDRTGRVHLSRRHLAALAELRRGRAVADSTGEELLRLGALPGGRPHPLVAPILAALDRAEVRYVVRRWRGAHLPAVEVLAGPSGVVALPDGRDPEAVQEVGWHPRREALARVLAEVVSAPAEDEPPCLDGRPRPWAELVGAASDPSSGLHLVDIAWSLLPEPSGTVMVLAWQGNGGLVEVRPTEIAATPVTEEEGLEGAEGSTPGATVRCRPRHPLEVWTALCRLATLGPDDA